MIDPRPRLGAPIWHDQYGSGVVVDYTDSDAKLVEADDPAAIVAIVRWDSGGWSPLHLDWLEVYRRQ
jgi:hypothetical protein